MPILGNVIKRTITLRKRMNFHRAEPVRYQLKVLKKLLRFARNTQFGRTYNFEKILQSPDIIQSFQDNVPLFNYKSIYQNWWSKAMDGQEDIFWPGKVKYFALSSGTTEGPSKYIPVTKDMLRAITKASFKQLYSMANFDLPSELYTKAIFTLGSSTDLDRQGDFFAGDMSGISADQAIPFWVQRFFKPGKRIMKKKDWDEKLDEIARNAPNWDIGVLAGIPVWVQIMLERVIEYHKVETIHDIWPNLMVYIHGGVAFEPYRKNFEKLFNQPITYIETYMASEGYFGFRARPETKSIQFILNNGHFYEFVPFDAKNFNEEGELKSAATVLDISEVEENVNYAVLISTVAGAWRYIIGDTVRFTDADRKEFIITGRTKHYLSICGEHLSVDNMNRAIQLVADELNISIPEFTVAGIPHENLFAHRWYIGTVDDVEPSVLASKLDHHLRTLNDDYATERYNVLKDVQVKVIRPSLFYAYLKSKGKVGDQVKFPRVMKRDRFAEWEEFVQKHTQ